MPMRMAHWGMQSLTIEQPCNAHSMPRTLSEAERQAHTTFIASLGNKAIWLDYRPVVPASAE